MDWAGLGRSSPNLAQEPVFNRDQGNLSESATQLERLAPMRQSAPVVALSVLTSLCRGEEQAVLGVPGRSISRLRQWPSACSSAAWRSLTDAGARHRPVPWSGRAFSTWRDDAIPRLFDCANLAAGHQRVSGRVGRRVDNET